MLSYDEPVFTLISFDNNQEFWSGPCAYYQVFVSSRHNHMRFRSLSQVELSQELCVWTLKWLLDKYVSQTKLLLPLTTIEISKFYPKIKAFLPSKSSKKTDRNTYFYKLHPKDDFFGVLNYISLIQNQKSSAAGLVLEFEM